MMSKKTFSRLSAAILLLLTVSTPVGAQEISVETARQTAAKFINEHAAKLPAKSRKGMMKAPPKAESLQLVYTQEDQLHESPALYVFEQPKQGGFVIASADERAYPILGYNENGTFREDSLPCCLKFILEEYGKQIAEARKQNLPRHTERTENESWQNIEPLLTCAWSQGAPFNNLCPIDKNTGRRCVTGCVATAMAQIMYYWKWPERGVGSHSYQTNNVEGTLTANFEETTYRWDLMKDDYEWQFDDNGRIYYDDPENAVATLMYHCGVALRMDYSSSQSGAGSIEWPLKEYFNYSHAISSINYDFENTIYKELLHKRPVDMSGSSKNSAHAYICDGYRTDGFFHFNLGWGVSNGYYKLNAVAEYYSYSSYSATINIAPKGEEIVDHYGNIYEQLGDEAYLMKGGDVKGHLEIPAQVTSSNGTKLPVSEITNGAFQNNTSITIVTIPNSVTSIGGSAFSGCTGLTSVSIPNSVTSIGKRAFSGCSGLTSVTIPNSVTSIGEFAFSGCSGLTSITIPNSVTSIGELAFSRCSGLTSVTIPNSVTSIGSRAFKETGIYNNSADGVFYVDKWVCGYKGTIPANTNLVIREGTLRIADYAFSGCSGLTSITIPNSVTSIGDYAFSGCSGLTSITIPNSVMSIGRGAFRNCSDLTSVTFHCKEIGPWFQGITTIKEIILGEEVTSIGNDAFYNCSSLTSVTIPNSVTSIGTWAFENCTGLTSITIPNSVMSIGRGAFRNCSDLTSVTFHCKEIGPWFQGITTIKEIILGEEVTSIGTNAFSECSGLTSITIPNSVTTIGVSAFYGCSGLTSVTISNSVTSIGSNAFKGCTGLTSVTIGNSVKSIGESAFRDCSGLTSVTIGNSVTSIGERAFEDCTGLQKVIVKDIAAWCRIEFNYASNPLEYAQHLYSDENTEITDLVIPDGVTSIGAFVFDGCEGLTSITIPNSVKSIGCQAFFAFEPALTSVVSDIVFPFYLDYAVFPHNKSATLYVPGGTSNLYKSYGWGDYFMEIVEREDNKAETITQEGITYVVYRGEAQVVGVSGNPEDVVIPASISNEKGERFSVINIAPNAFSNLYKVTSITIPNTVTTIAGDLFSNYSLTTINVEDGNPAYSSIDGVLFNKDQTELIKCPRGKHGAYVIPNSVKGIGDNAFRSCRLTNVTIPNSVETIGREAFNSCYGLTSVTLPSSLTSMGAYVFAYCRNITSVVSHIEIPFEHGRAFYEMNNQATLYVPIGTLEKYKALSEWNNAFKEIVEFDINGIEDVTVSNSNSSDSENAPMYNLSGQRVGKNYKGIVIKNGKKMIVK